MKKLITIACLLLSAVTYAQTAPKVVFTGDQFTGYWQVTPFFEANANWIGAAVTPCCLGNSSAVAAAFQANVINQHPAFVVITTGESDIEAIHDATPLGVAWTVYEQSIVEMVDMAHNANIKVILGNTPATGYYAQYFNVWLGQYAAASGLPVLNFHDALCQCAGLADSVSTSYATLSQDEPTPTLGPTRQGYALITQMAQTAIATYGLTIKSGWLNDVTITNAFPGNGPPALVPVNNVPQGTQVLFTPQATWSDGVNRPMLNDDYNGLRGGTWTSSNPFVMTINQQGQAYAYGPGTARISFKTANGIMFSPWDMTITAIE
jgi:hypothetical protein